MYNLVELGIVIYLAALLKYPDNIYLVRCIPAIWVYVFICTIALFFGWLFYIFNNKVFIAEVKKKHHDKMREIINLFLDISILVLMLLNNLSICFVFYCITFIGSKILVQGIKKENNTNISTDCE